MAGIAAAAIAAGASLAGSGISAFGASQSAKAQKAEAERNREFQRSFYQHRYQWQMADMKAAGLNPILSYHQAPSGMGSPSSVAPINVGEAFKEGLPRAVSSALSARKAVQEYKIMEQEQKKKVEETYATATLGAKYRAEHEQIVQQTKNLQQQFEIDKAAAASAKAMEDLYRKYPELRKLELIRRSFGGSGVVGGVIGGALAGRKAGPNSAKSVLRGRKFPNPNKFKFQKGGLP